MARFNLLLISMMTTLLLFSAGFCFAQTLVGSDIISNTVWTVSGSPYVIQDNIFIASAASLTVEPGVRVEFSGNYRLHVNGRLVARGTPEQPIVFTSSKASPAPGDWETIFFSEYSHDAVLNSDPGYVSGSILEYCHIEYAYNGVEIFQSAPAVHHCRIMKCNGNGIRLDNTNALIWENRVENCNSNGIHSFVSTARIRRNYVIGNKLSGIYCYDSDPEVTANICNNNNYGIGVAYGNESEISRNVILRNKIAGISVQYDSQPVIFENYIYNNAIYSIELYENPYDILAEDNYWNTEDLDAIDDSIYDRKSDFRQGTVDYEPLWDITAVPNLARDTNPDFEAGMDEISGRPRQWIASNDYGAGITDFTVMAPADGSVFDGTFSAWATSSRGTGFADYVTASLTTDRPIPLFPRYTYTFTAYVRAVDSQWVRLVLFDEGYPRAALMNYSETVLDDTWTKIQLKYAPDSATLYFLRVDSILPSYHGSAELVVDGIELTAEVDDSTWTGGLNSEMGVAGLVNYDGREFKIPSAWNPNDDGIGNAPDYPVWGQSPDEGIDEGYAGFISAWTDEVGVSDPQLYSDWMTIGPANKEKAHTFSAYIRTHQTPIVRLFYITNDWKKTSGLVLKAGISPDRFKRFRVKIIPDYYDNYLMARVDSIVLPDFVALYPHTVYIDRVELGVEQ